MPSSTNPFSAIAEALAAEARKSIRAARARDAARPIGEQAIDIDFYKAADRNRPLDQQRWCATLVRWTGSEWKRTRRLSGPQSLSDALSLASSAAAARNLKRVGA